jgi:citrate lyase subunit beta/citryl-CoA lyase
MAAATTAEPRGRPRRACLLVPAGRDAAHAAASAADEVVLDLEDTVPEARKDAARIEVVRALTGTDWGDKTVAVRVNAVETPWTLRDVLAVVGEAGEIVDCLVVPKVQAPGELEFVDHLVRMVSDEQGLEHEIGLEAQVGNAAGLALLDEIAVASDRLEALVLSPVDLAASLGMPAGPGAPGGDATWHGLRQRVLVTARAAGLQAVDGPFPRVGDAEGFRAAALAARAQGYDGAWALTTAQADAAHAVFTPAVQELAQAEDVLAAHRRAAQRDGTGAVLLGDELVDDAGRRLAEVTVLRARAAGVERPRSQKPRDRGRR